MRLGAGSELPVSGMFAHCGDCLRLALNPDGGLGGICFDDSDDPDLLGGTNTGPRAKIRGRYGPAC